MDNSLFTFSIVNTRKKPIRYSHIFTLPQPQSKPLPDHSHQLQHPHHENPVVSPVVERGSSQLNLDKGLRKSTEQEMKLLWYSRPSSSSISSSTSAIQLEAQLDQHQDISPGFGQDEEPRRFNTNNNPSSSREDGGKEVKRPLNSFMLFSKKYRKIFKEQDKSLDNQEVSRLLGKKWGSMSSQEKEPYVQEAEEILRKFKEENPDFIWHKDRQLQKKDSPMKKRRKKSRYSMSSSADDCKEALKNIVGRRSSAPGTTPFHFTSSSQPVSIPFLEHPSDHHCCSESCYHDSHTRPRRRSFSLPVSPQSSPPSLPSSGPHSLTSPVASPQHNGSELHELNIKEIEARINEALSLSCPSYFCNNHHPGLQPQPSAWCPTCKTESSVSGRPETPPMPQPPFLNQQPPLTVPAVPPTDLFLFGDPTFFTNENNHCQTNISTPNRRPSFEWEEYNESCASAAVPLWSSGPACLPSSSMKRKQYPSGSTNELPANFELGVSVEDQHNAEESEHTTSSYSAAADQPDNFFSVWDRDYCSCENDDDTNFMDSVLD